MNDPVAQASPPQIVEGARFDGSQMPDLGEVMAELGQGRSSPFDGPLPHPAEFLNALVPSHWNKDVQVPFRLRRLKFNQQLHQASGQRKRSALGVLDMPLPGVLAILLRRDIDGHIREVDVSPRSFHEFATPLASTQTHTNEQFPLDRRACLCVERMLTGQIPNGWWSIRLTVLFVPPALTSSYRPLLLCSHSPET
jgi:hypothetical protein